MLDSRVQSKDDILQASPVIIRIGNFPCRVVLRKLAGKFVTHMEILLGADGSSIETGCKFIHHSFVQSRYFVFSFGNQVLPESEILAEAMADFDQRVSKLCQDLIQYRKLNQ